MSIQNERPNYDRPTPSPDFPQEIESVPILAESVIRKGWAWEFLLWLILLGLVAFTIWQQNAAMEELASESKTTESVPVLVENLISKMLFFVRVNDPASSNIEQLETLNNGSVQQRLVYVIMMAEFDSPDAGLRALDSLLELIKKNNYTATQTQSKLLECTQRILSARSEREARGELFDPVKIEPSERDFILKELGWAGELLLASKTTTDTAHRAKVVAEASRVSYVLGPTTICGVFYGLAGFVLLVVLIVRMVVGKSRIRDVDNSNSGIVYLETFVLWFLLFIGLQYLVAMVLVAVDPASINEPSKLEEKFSFLAPIIFLTPLLCLAWPVLRGRPWKQVKKDIGWTRGEGAIELPAGIIGHAAGIPLIIVGFIGVAVLFGLKSLFVTESNPLAGEETLTHPIQEVLANGNVYAIVFAVMMASICAPIVEETVFRGVFYRYLRDRSVAWARWPSICVSALMNSLIFAAIHPQGWEAVPALAAIGVTLTLIRVWRGSLLGPMAAHCFHNTVLLGLSLLIMQ